MIAIIDYGMGNLRSVQKAFEYLGYKAVVTSDLQVIRKADKVILPGVGAFRDAISALHTTGLAEELYRVVESKKPLLGICLGMQLLFEKSYENGEYDGLSILPGIVKKLPEEVKIPHMGWNSLQITKTHPLFVGLPEEPFVYFVHSYHLETSAPIVSATTYYGKEVQVAAQKESIFALQFHPEKSGDTGLMILKNFGGL